MDTGNIHNTACGGVTCNEIVGLVWETALKDLRLLPPLKLAFSLWVVKGTCDCDLVTRGATEFVFFSGGSCPKLKLIVEQALGPLGSLFLFGVQAERSLSMHFSLQCRSRFYPLQSSSLQ